MAWIENIKRDYTITCGDGVKFVPNWLNARRSVEFNISVFNFRNIKGSKVDRQQPMGRVYDIEIYFQGENNLNIATDFMDSAENKKPWQVSHPMYGQLFVQPLSLSLDDRDFNVTKVTGQMMETIGNTLIKTNIDPIETIKAKALQTDITSATAYETNIPEALASDISQMQDNSTFVLNAQLAFATITQDAQAATNAYNQANAAIDNAASDTFAAIRGIQRLINLPATFSNTIVRRVNFLINTAAQLYSDITTLTTPRQKRLYENNMAAMYTTMCVASVTNPSASDYNYRVTVVQLIDTMLASYNTFLENLNVLQTDTGDNPDSYVPNFDTLNQLDSVFKFTIANLISIAENAKQQRFYTLPSNSTVILLAYKFYGLLPDDSTITQVINENALGLNDLLILKKGRVIYYYV